MKILMISETYPPSIGGVEKEVQTLSEGLIHHKNCRVSVFTINNNKLPRFREENKVKIYRYNGFFQKIPFLYSDPNKKYHPPVRDIIITSLLKKIIKKEKPDIIHTHDWILYSYLPLKNYFNIPVCATFHGFGFICPLRWSESHNEGICSQPLSIDCIKCSLPTYGLLKTLFSYIGVKRHENFSSDIIIYTNPNIVEKMNNLKQKKIYIGHPINTDIYKKLMTRKFTDKLLCWVKLEKVKGIDIIFQVAKLLPEYEFHIPFIGKDKLYFKQIKPKNVLFLKPIKTENIPVLLNKYPLILGQFHLGAFGLSELEAMSCGTPVIAYWNRKYDKFYNEQCPILSSNDINEIVNLIKTNIDNNNLREKSIKWIKNNHSIPIIIDKLYNVYENIIKEKN